MKRFFGSLLILLSLSVSSQPVLIAEDDSPYDTDGYQALYMIDTAQGIDGLSFFTTPNFRLYQTNGTEKGTRVLHTFPRNSLIYLKGVTHQYIYYTEFINRQHELKRMNRQTLKHEPVMLQKNPLVMETGYSAMTMHPDRNYVTVRFHENKTGLTILVALSDTGSARAEYITFNLKREETARIEMFSAIGFIGTQVFYNGWDKPIVDGKPMYETTIASSIPGRNKAGDSYLNHSIYQLRARGLEINSGFAQLGDSLFITGYLHNKQTGNRDLAIAGLHWDELAIPHVIETDQQFAFKTVIGDELYIHNGNRLLAWKQGMHEIEEIFRKKSYQYLALQPGKSLMKVKNYLVFREDEGTILYDLQRKTFTTVEGPVAVQTQNNLYRLLDNYLFTSSRYLYYLTNSHDIPSLMRYDPDTKKADPVLFPEYKKETFKAVNAILQTGNRFIILTTYTGKKNKPAYKVFAFEG